MNTSTYTQNSSVSVPNTMMVGTISDCRTYPNPVTKSVCFDFIHAGGKVTIDLIAADGTVKTIHNSNPPAGRQRLFIRRMMWAAGSYDYRIYNGSGRELAGKLVVVD